MNRPDLAKSLRQDPRACDPLALCKALGIDKGSIRQPRGRTILCPAHGEKSPSCSVRIAPDDTIAARCFSCGWSADALGLIGKVLGLDFKGALEWLADYVAI